MIPHRILNYTAKQSMSSAVIFIFFVVTVFLAPGCSYLFSSATSSMMEHLSKTILNNDDLSLVENGAPAYLLMIDSFISKDPDNEETLTTAALLYTAYADLFVKDPARSRKIADKALEYASRAVCLTKKDACLLKSISFEKFDSTISTMKKQHLPSLFALGNAWAAWIMANKTDFNAIADISRIELIMQKIIMLDKTYKDGAAYLYLGTLATLLPPALGGRPEQGRQYFETAVDLSRGKNLMVKVLYAKLYARMIFDRPLHDQLLEDVLAADPEVPDYTLINTWAQQQAKGLIATADDYF